MTGRPAPPTCVTCKWVRIHIPAKTRITNRYAGTKGGVATYKEVEEPTFAMDEYNCTRDVPLYDAVSGQTHNLNSVARDCYYMRKFRGGDRRRNDRYAGGNCGPEGKLWEPKDEPS